MINKPWGAVLSLTCKSLLLNQAKLGIQLQTLSRAPSKATTIQNIKHCEKHTFYHLHTSPRSRLSQKNLSIPEGVQA